jgi:hypothetical protein
MISFGKVKSLFRERGTPVAEVVCPGHLKESGSVHGIVDVQQQPLEISGNLISRSRGDVNRASSVYIKHACRRTRERVVGKLVADRYVLSAALG